ncbi:hypothetical protein K438DRAFT_1967570 [Mycena galopus ATCC 62051]|nr:hypothetical protein K438DRAFT_1967570 [Mycena galopus ATCC 62051]
MSGNREVIFFVLALHAPSVRALKYLLTRVAGVRLCFLQHNLHVECIKITYGGFFIIAFIRGESTIRSRGSPPSSTLLGMSTKRTEPTDSVSSTSVLSYNALREADPEGTLLFLGQLRELESSDGYSGDPLAFAEVFGAPRRAFSKKVVIRVPDVRPSRSPNASSKLACLYWGMFSNSIRQSPQVPLEDAFYDN